MAKKRLSAKLPEIPAGAEFEEYVSAAFQCAGNYIERNLINREEEEILELDIITTDYQKDDKPNITLIEAKSGGWGFPDLFKLLGWTVFLNIPNARFVVNDPKDSFDFHKETIGKHGIDLVCTEKHAVADSVAEDLGCPPVDPLDINLWRYSYWIERSLIRYMREKKKKERDKKAFPALSEYYHVLNSSVFFTSSVVSRAKMLYKMFQKYPLISAKCGHELEGGAFDDEHCEIPTTIFNNTFYEAKLTPLHISSFIEHRARLAILKTLVDYTLYKKHGDTEKAPDNYTIRFGGKVLADLPALDFVPESYRTAIDKISQDPYFHRYPIFWQWFMWFFGGFILLDYEEQEYTLLSMKTGIPKEHIPKAFASYEILFPRTGGWFTGPTSQCNCRMMRIFPAPFRGLGAYYRRTIYSDNGAIGKLTLTGTYTLDDLAKWNDLAVELLTTYG